MSIRWLPTGLQCGEFPETGRGLRFQHRWHPLRTTAQTAAQKEATVSLYVEEEQTYVTDYYRQRERAYYESKIATITSVDELTSDARLFDYVKTAFQLENVSASTFKQIVTSDTSDPDSYAATNGGDAGWRWPASSTSPATGRSRAA